MAKEVIIKFVIEDNLDDDAFRDELLDCFQDLDMLSYNYLSDVIQEIHLIETPK